MRAEENRYWVHKGGGISGVDLWSGPFDLPFPPVTIRDR